MWLTAPGGFWFVMLTTVIPYALPSYLFAAAVLLLLRRRAAPAVRRQYAAGAVLALAGVVLHTILLAPSYLGAHAEGRPDLSVMNVNTKRGGASATQVVTLARENKVDLLVLEEVDSAAFARLRTAGIEDLFPYAGGGAGDGGSGTMVFSVYPLLDQERLATRLGGYRLRVLGPDPFWLLAVHPSQPLKRPGAWAQDWHAINRAAAALPGTRLVVGDFNATLDHQPVRDLLDSRTGLADAARRSNAGWQPTWSGQNAGLALITIDHVLFSPRFDAIDARAEKVAGTDHRALIVDLKRLGG